MSSFGTEKVKVWVNDMTQFWSDGHLVIYLKMY